MKQNKGITLIALVITIIVLVILVGVSVSVAINTGLIENSKKAVSDYDNAQKAEGQAIEEIAWEINSQVNKNALKIYDGVVVVEPNQTLANIKSKLPSGYTIGDDNGTEITDESTIILTGMKILNSNGIVGRVVLLGDVDEDTEIQTLDGDLIQQAVAGDVEGLEYLKQDYIRVVMDVNRDGKINQSDASLIFDYEVSNIMEFPNKGYTGSASSIRTEQILTTNIYVFDEPENCVEEDGTYSVAGLETKLTNGATIGDTNGNPIEALAKSSTTVSTGMTIIRNNQIVGRVAVLGDIDCTGSIDLADYAKLTYTIANNIEVEDYVKAACDVNNDGKINSEDSQLLDDFIKYNNENWNFDENNGKFPDEGFEGGASLIVIGD